MLAIARALMVPAKVILLDEPFEGLAPAIVKEVMDALAKLRGRVAMVIVEHHAETVLPLVDRAYVLVNGRVAFEGTAKSLEDDPDAAGPAAGRRAEGSSLRRSIEGTQFEGRDHDEWLFPAHRWSA